MDTFEQWLLRHIERAAAEVEQPKISERDHGHNTGVLYAYNRALAKYRHFTTPQVVEQLNVPTAAKTFLLRSGIQTVAELQQMSRADLLLVPGIGPKRVKALEDGLALAGCSLK